MTISEEPLVYCDRCKGPGGVAYKGWQLLCRDCAAQDQAWYEDKGE